MKKKTFFIIAILCCSIMVPIENIQAGHQNEKTLHVEQNRNRIKAAHFKIRNSLAVRIPDFEWDVQFEIVSYDMIYVPRNADIVISTSTRMEFTAVMKNYIARAKPEDQYYFENIRVKGPSGDIRHIKGVYYRIY